MENIGKDGYAPLKSTLPQAIGIQNFFLRGVRKSVVDMLQRFGARNVLDVCSGGGTLAHMLRQQGMTVQAVDASPTMADYSRTRYGIITKVMEAEKLNYHEQFDAAIIGMSLHELGEQQREEVWNHIEEAVKTTGIVIAVDYTAPPAGFLNRLVQNMVTLDESTFDAVSPGHYPDYTKFMAEGGLLSWLQKHKGYLHEQRTHMFGNIAVVAVMKQ